MKKKCIKKWCNVHQRDAERCKTEGGIMIPCKIIDCEEVGIEILEDNEFFIDKNGRRVKNEKTKYLPFQ